MVTLNNTDNDNEVLSDNAIIEKFQTFLYNYKDNNNHYKYFERINQLIGPDDKTLFVEYQDLDSELLSFFFNNNQVERYLKLLSDAVKQIVIEQNDFDDRDDDIVQNINAKLSINDKHLITNMRQINISHRSKLVVFDSTIVSKSERKSTFSQKVFKCSMCRELYTTKQNRCVNEECGPKTINVSIADSKLTDCEYIECQERQEDLLSN